jgi:hypothetical protein
VQIPDTLAAETRSPATRTPETVPAPGPVQRGRLAALRQALRARRANRSSLAREITAYPATRSAAMTVLPADRRSGTSGAPAVTRR